MVERVMTTATSQVRAHLPLAGLSWPAGTVWRDQLAAPLARCLPHAHVSCVSATNRTLFSCRPQVGLDLNAVASCAWLSTPLQFVPG